MPIGGCPHNRGGSGDDAAARTRFVKAGDFHLITSKNQAPELLPRPDLYGARFTSDRAAIVVSYRDGDRRCQTTGTSAARVHQRGPSARWRARRAQCPCHTRRAPRGHSGAVQSIDALRDFARNDFGERPYRGSARPAPQYKECILVCRADGRATRSALAFSREMLDDLVNANFVKRDGPENERQTTMFKLTDDGRRAAELSFMPPVSPLKTSLKAKLLSLGYPWPDNLDDRFHKTDHNSTFVESDQARISQGHLTTSVPANIRFEPRKRPTRGQHHSLAKS
jgi:hypothetical protein